MIKNNYDEGYKLNLYLLFLYSQKLKKVRVIFIEK